MRHLIQHPGLNRRVLVRRDIFTSPGISCIAVSLFISERVNGHWKEASKEEPLQSTHSKYMYVFRRIYSGYKIQRSHAV